MVKNPTNPLIINTFMCRWGFCQHNLQSTKRLTGRRFIEIIFFKKLFTLPLLVVCLP